MAWSAHPTITTGQAWTATDQNTYVKGNLDTLFPYTAGLQISYSTSTTALNKLTSTAAYQVVRANTGATSISFVAPAMIYMRQGYSTAAWCLQSTSTATTNYQVSNAYIQTGTFMTGSAATEVIFPTAFSKPPIVFTYKPAALYPSTEHIIYLYTFPTSTSFYVQFSGSIGGFSPNTNINWLAIGEI